MQEIFNSISNANFVLKKEVDSMKAELSEHLDSINDNTNEIQANYEYLCRLDAKIDKLNEKIEQVMLLFSQAAPKSEQFEVDTNLTQKEKMVFLVLYTAAEQRPLSYAEIAQILKEEESLVAEYITNLIEKGIPVTKKYICGKAYLSLDREFRDLQAKRNILNISQTTVRQFA